MRDAITSGPRRYVLAALLLAAACDRPATMPPADNPRSALPVPPAAALTARELPIWWSPTIELDDLDDVEPQLDTRQPFGFGGLAHGDQTLMPKTCRDRERLKARGFEPETTLEAQADAAAEIRCGTLRLLARVHPARRSFVPDALEPLVVPDLPAQLATAFSNERSAERDAAARAGESLLAFESRVSALNDAGGALLVKELGYGTSVQLALQARGDFDADGYEDIALSVRNTADRGSYFATRLLVLTRASNDQQLAVVP
jgi:hypothetical protein